METTFPSPAAAPAWKKAVLLLLALIAIFTAYSPALSGEFVWDDHNLIERSSSVRQLRPLPSYFLHGFWNPADQASRQSSGYYRPLTALSYAAEWKLWDGAPSGFHLTNLLFHLGNCLLLFLLALKLDASFGHAAFAMTLFGLLPRLTETTAWISGRTDSMACTFVLSALLAWPRTLSESGRGMLRAAGAAVLVLMGLFCKEVAAAAAAAIGAVELGRLLRKENLLRDVLCRLAPLVLALIAYGALRFVSADGKVAQDFLTDAGPSMPPRILTVLAALGSFVRMAVLFPWPELQIGSINLAPLPLAALGAAALTALAAALFKIGPRRLASHPLFPLGVLAAAAILPVLHLVPLKLRCLTADRFLYVPAAAFAVCLAAAAGHLCANGIQRIFVRSVSALILCLCFASSLLQAERWSSERRLFAWGCETAPKDNAAACLLLATSLIEDGLPESALEAYDKAERLEAQANPEAWRGYSLIRAAHGKALAWTHLGRHREAAEALNRLADEFPAGGHAVKIHSLAAMSWLRLGDTQKARDEVRLHLLPLRNGAALASSFEQLAVQSENVLNQLGDAREMIAGQQLDASQLDDGALAGTARFAQLLGDRFLQTQAFAEILRRDTFAPEVRESAARWLEASGICSVLAKAFADAAVRPPRCAPPPPEVWE